MRTRVWVDQDAGASGKPLNRRRLVASDMGASGSRWRWAAIVPPHAAGHNARSVAVDRTRRSTGGAGPSSAREGSIPCMTHDPWLADLLLDRSGMLSDADIAQELAATLAARDPALEAHAIATTA